MGQRNIAKSGVGLLGFDDHSAECFNGFGFVAFSYSHEVKIGQK